MLLGVTPELADIGGMLVSIDWSAPMRAHIWPGDSPTRSARAGDWRALPTFEQPFDAAIGDGSLNVAADLAELTTILANVRGALRIGGRIAIRCYLTPEPREPLTAIARDVLAGKEPSFHALKWRIAMAVRGGIGAATVAVADILAAFDAAFADRPALAAATGWNLATIAEIDAYRDADARYCFPTATELRDSIPSGLGRFELRAAGSYPLAERCPILLLERTV